MIRNPILPGFNPDPSICRVGEDYYIATSTFEWYPGVQIHHSTNLVDWTLLTRPLRRAAQLNMRGNPDSCGVWAPCLSHADGQFWLIYSDVKRYSGNFNDAHNYLVTATDVSGEWSDPVYLNSSGFDPSLFHDDDGRKWLINLNWDYRNGAPGRERPGSNFGGIVLQEYDSRAQTLLGEPRVVFEGSERGITEGAHLLKREGWYIMITAEGGTGYEHAVTHARSRSIDGPYELHPDVHVITADPENAGTLQRAGHGQPVETPSGEWYHVHLCSRPLNVKVPDLRRSPLGRESGIQAVEWCADGWMRLVGGGQAPLVHVSAPELPGVPARYSPIANAPDDPYSGAMPAPVDDADRVYTFDGHLPLDFQWLRLPEWCRLFSLEARPGYLRLYGRESLGSWFEQGLVARRQQHLSYAAETRIDVQPTSHHQGAGLIAYYDRQRFFTLYVSHDQVLGRVVRITGCAGDWPLMRLSWPVDSTHSLDDGEVELGCDVIRESLQFRWRPVMSGNVSDGHAEGPVNGPDDGRTNQQFWRSIGPELDASLLSDEAARGEHASFTGAFVGVVAFDTSGQGMAADVSRFRYLPRH